MYLAHLTNTSFHRIILAMALCVAATAHTAEPIYQATFDDTNFEASGWSAAASGGGQFDPASVSIGLIPVSPSSPDYSNGRGIVITASPGQGSFLVGPAIDVGDDLVVLRVSVLALAGGGSVAAGALNTLQGGTLADADGSVTYAIEADSQRYVDDYQTITLLYRPRQKAIVPLLQLAVSDVEGAGPVTMMFDNFEVYALNESTVADPVLRNVFGIGFSSSPQVTPTPTVTPVSPVLSTAEISVDSTYELSPTDDDKEAFDPSAAFDRNSVYSVVAADLTGGFQDILLRTIDNNTIGDPVTVNKTFEDTAAQSPDIAIDFAGTHHVIWADNRSVQKLFSVYLTPIDSFGNRLLEGDYEVNDPYDDTNVAEPSIANDGDNLVAIWRDDRNYVYDLYARRMRWTGGQIESIDSHDFLVNVPFENTNVAQSDACIDSLGNIIAVWSDNRLILNEKKRSDIYARIFNIDTQPTTENILPQTVLEIQLSELDTVYSNATDPHIASMDGVYLTVWRENDPDTERSSIHGAAIDDRGQFVTPEFIIDEDSAESRNLAPDVTALTVGEFSYASTFFITWHDAANNRIVGRIYDAKNNLFLTDPTTLADSVSGVGTTSLAIGEDYDFITAWDAAIGTITDLFGLSGKVGTGLQELQSTLSAPKLVREQGAVAKKLHREKIEPIRYLQSQKISREMILTSPQRDR